MKRDDIEKLLGAYATGTLTAGERAALYEAALEDQALYDALMREEPLRELFEDPIARARMIAVLAGSPSPKRGWWFRPAPWAVAGALATVGLVAFFMVAPRPPADIPLARMELKSVPSPVLTEKKVIARVPSRKPPAQESFKDAVSAEAPMPQAGDVKTAFRKMERADAPAAVGTGGFQPDSKKEADRGVAASVQIEAQPAPVMGAIGTLSYKVLRQSGEQFVEAAPDTVFASGDVVRLAVVPPADGQLVLHADPEVTLHTVAAKKGEPVIIPATGGIKLGPGTGSRTVRLVFAAPIEAKGMANTMRARSASAQQTADSSSGATPVTVDVVLQFR